MKLTVCLKLMKASTRSRWQIHLLGLICISICLFIHITDVFGAGPFLLDESLFTPLSSTSFEYNLHDNDVIYSTDNYSSSGQGAERLFSQALSCLKKNENRLALDYLRQALPLVLEDEENSLLQASITYYTGLALASLGLLQESLDQYQEAIRIAEANNDLIIVLKGHNKSGEILNRQGKYLQALGELAKASGLEKKLINISDPSAGQIYGRILAHQGTSSYHLGDFNQALSFFDLADRYFDENEDKVGRLITRIHIANTNLNLGKIKKAIVDYEKAESQAEEIGDDKRKGDALSGLALAFQFEGRQQEALNILQTALNLHQKAGAAAALARDRNNLGLVYENVGNYKEAEKYYSKAIVDFRHLKKSAVEGMVWANLGYLSLLDNQLEKSRKELSQARKVLEQSDDLIKISITYEYTGRLYLALKKYEDAIIYFEKALELAEEMSRPETLWRAWAGLGAANRAEGNSREALKYYQQSVETIEQLRQHEIESEFQGKYLYDKLDVYNSLIRLFIKVNDKYAALESLERRNQWRLRDKLRKDLSFQERQRNDLFVKERALFSKMHAMERGINKISIGNDRSGRALKQFGSHLKSVKQEHQNFLSKIKREDLDLYRRLSAEKFAPINLVRSLPDDTAVIAYFLDGENLFIFSVTAEGLKMTSTIGVAKILEEKTVLLRKAVSGPQANLQESLRSFHQAAFIFYDVLIKPLDEEIHSKKFWFLLPDEMLWNIPFAAIAQQTDTGVRYLVDDHVLSYVNSFNANSKGDLIKSQVGQQSARIVAFGNPEGMLPAADKEIQLAKTIDPEALIFSGKEANEPNFRAHAREADILVIASHAFRPPSTETTYISIAPSISHDGRLTVNEIRGLDLKGVSLVVLSGCGTALSHEQGNIFLSLADAFLFAGAGSVIATLWDISDQGTYELMTRFNAHFRKNGNYQEALRLAQKNCLTENTNNQASQAQTLVRGIRYISFQERHKKNEHLLDLSHPYYWAPFIVIKAGMPLKNVQ